MVTLDPEETVHLTRVLRLGVGARVEVCDGEGGNFAAQVAALEPRGATLRILGKLDAWGESPLPVVLGVGLAKGEVLDEAGQPCLRMRATETVGFGHSTPVGRGMSTPPPDAITGEMPPGAPTVRQASKWVPVGSVLPSLTKQTTLEQSIAYSGFPYGWVEGGAKAVWVNIHTDPEDARRRGQPDAIMQGLCSAAYLSELCMSFFGPSWLTTGRFSTAFIRPVIVRDTITAAGLVKRLEDEGERKRLWLDLWCKNQRGELVTVGRASALVE